VKLHPPRQAIPQRYGRSFPRSQVNQRGSIVVVISQDKDKIIVNVTMPFEGEPGSLAVARQTKERKYDTSAIK